MPSETGPETVLKKGFTRQEPVPQAAVDRVVGIPEAGRPHGYDTAPDRDSDVSLREPEFARDTGTRYDAAFNSCGSAVYIALKSVGAMPGDKMRCNAFTPAPVPGAIELSRPPLEVFERFKKRTPDYSPGMTDPSAAPPIVQLKKSEPWRVGRNRRYFILERCLHEIDKIVVPQRHPKEGRPGGAIRFRRVGPTGKQSEQLMAGSSRRGVEIKWFGCEEPAGFTICLKRLRIRGGRRP